MKKMISITVAVVMVLALMIPVFASAGQYGGRDMWINCANGKKLNVRREPNTNSQVIVQLPCGTRVEVMDELGNGWVRIATDEYVGCVMKKFLVSGKPGKYEITERDDNFVAVAPYMVSAKPLNNRTEESVGLRVKPNKTSGAIRRLVAGDELEVIARGKTWLKVVDPLTGQTGFVANDYMQRM